MLILIDSDGVFTSFIKCNQYVSYNKKPNKCKSMEIRILQKEGKKEKLKKKELQV